MALAHSKLTAQGQISAVQDPATVAAAIAQFRRLPAVGFSDCLMVEVARKAGHGPLGRCDRGLAKVEGTQRL